jgi:hypothetical protein
VSHFQTIAIVSHRKIGLSKIVAFFFTIQKISVRIGGRKTAESPVNSLQHAYV